jgi:magnesium transporter
MAFFTKRYHPPGTSPGSLRAHPVPISGPANVRLVRYGPSSLDVTSAVESLPEPPAVADAFDVTWLHVQGRPSEQLLTRLGEKYQLHSLALEDIHNGGQRPKLDEFHSQIFATLSLPRFEGGRVDVYQASFFLATNYVLSFCEGPIDPFEPLLRRLQEGAGRIRNRGPDYLLYALVDTVVDQGFPVLEAFGFELEDLEEKVLERPTPDTLSHIHTVRRELILLRRMLWPQREVVNALVRDDTDLIRDETRVFLRDCYDHTIQVMDLMETYRDMSASMLDIYLSSASNRMNEIMRVLTVIATIFMPLTFVVGLYGMNFGINAESPWAMPELHWYYGYPLVWLLMIVIAAGMLTYFWRRRWL